MTNETLFLSVQKYENPYKVMVHDGSYAFNAKHPYGYVNSMPENDFEMAYEEAYYCFHSQIMTLCNLYGFDTFEVDGRSSGWLKPVYKGKPVPAVYDDYLTFEEYVLQERVCSLFILMDEVFNNIKRILRYSKSFEEFNKTMERYMSL